MKKKMLLFVFFCIGVIVFFYLDLEQYLSLKIVKGNLSRLQEFYATNALTAILSFIGLYIFTVALSLPGAAVLTLAGGAIFGPWMGTLTVNLGATIGATLAFMAARFLFRDWVEKKFGANLKPFNSGFSKNAVNYILFLRLIPLFPFFIINLVSGVTSVRLRVYFFGTMFGTLPGTFVYANAGSNLASINSTGDVVSSNVLSALILLGAFALIPAIYKKIKAKKKYS